MDTDGSNIYFGMKYLWSKGRSAKNGVQWMNAITATAFFSATSKCEGALEAGELVLLNCDPPILNGTKFVDNINCKQCLKQKQDLFATREAYETEAHSENSNYTKQTWSDPTVQAEWEDNNPNTNSCKFVCTSCLFLKNEQSLQVRMTTECSNLVSQPYDKGSPNAFFNNMSDAIAIQSQDLINSYRADLEQIGIDTEAAAKKAPVSIKEKIMNKVAIENKGELLNVFRNAAITFQSTVVEPGTNSIVSSNNVQNFNLNSVFQATSLSRVGENLWTAEQEAIAFKNFQKNDKLSDLLKQAENTGTALENLWSSGGGKILLILLVFLLIVIIVVAAVFYFAK